MSRAAVIVQARTGSTRLPGKVLQDLQGKTVLARVLDRCAAIPGIDAVVCATSSLPQDDPVAEAAQSAGATVFRGSENDVLARYLGAARAANAETVLRVTADCPLIDPTICRAVLDLRESSSADYAANNMPRLYPHGLDCEAFTTAALTAAADATRDVFDREHVTPWLRRAPGLKRANLVGPGWPANMHRWTLDYPEDLSFFRAVFANPDTASMQDVLSLLAARLDIAELNAHLRADPQVDAAIGTVVFRCDADSTIGLGHAMRCGALQDRLMSLGWQCLWAVEPATAAFLGIGLDANRTILLDANDPKGQASKIAAAVSGRTVMVIDRYGTSVEFSSACRAFADRIVHIDDFETGDVPADIAVTIGAASGAASGDRPGPPRRLIGGRYAPLRRQFSWHRSASLKRRLEHRELKHVLVGLGGSDTADASSLAVQAVLDAGLACDIAIGGKAQHLSKLQAVAERDSRAHLRIDAAEMAALMAAADLAIGAPGTSTWERATLGLPVLMVAIAENQRDNATVVTKAGAGILCGVTDDQTRSEIAKTLLETLSRLRAQSADLAAMSARSAELCDGRGAMRIGVAMLPDAKLARGQSCRFRLVEPEDETLVLDWQTAPETRRYAVNPQPPTAEEHAAWFAAKLASDGDWFMIAETTDGPAGFVRLDWLGEAGGAPIFVVSIATAPGHYRKGIGRAMLEAARMLAPRARLLARVLPGNHASLALFESLGYRPGEDGYLISTPQNIGSA